LSSWRITRKHYAERLRAGIEAQSLAAVIAMAGIEHGQIEAARQPSENRTHFLQHAGNLVHVPPHEDVGHAGGR
jgi:hypothetical protein